MSSSRQATLRWSGHGKAFWGSVGSGLEVTIDGDARAGASPMDSVLLGLMGCMGIDVLWVLEKSRVPLDSFEIRAEAERNTNPPGYYKQIRLTFVLEGVAAGARPKIDRAIQLSREKYCSVLHSLRPDLDFVTFVEAVAAPPAPAGDF